MAGKLSDLLKRYRIELQRLSNSLNKNRGGWINLYKKLFEDCLSKTRNDPLYDEGQDILKSLSKATQLSDLL